MALKVDIKKRLGNFLLDVCFEAEQETMALLGSSGCGKSMTLKCIAGIATPDEGYIELNGRVLFDSKKRINIPVQERHVGYLFQQYALFPNMNVAENIAVGVRDKGKRTQIVEDKIRALKLQGLEHKYPQELSGGQQQRVALARILVNEPEVLLLDEPFSALDSFLKWQLELELSELLEQFMVTTIFVSHSRDEVYRLCENVCVLNSGKSEEKADVKQLFHAPKTVASCLLSGCKNFSKVEKIDNYTLKATDWGAYLQTSATVHGDVVEVGVQAYAIHLVDIPEKENTITCTLERIVHDIFTDTLVVKPVDSSKETTRICIEQDKMCTSRFAIGSVLYVHIPKDAVTLLTTNTSH